MSWDSLWAGIPYELGFLMSRDSLRAWIPYDRPYNQRSGLRISTLTLTRISILPTQVCGALKQENAYLRLKQPPLVQPCFT